MCPICVFMPVSVTTAHALPAAALVPANTRFRHSAAGSCAEKISRASFSTGSDSPVSADSSVLNPVVEMSRPSAGMQSPSSSSITSPATTFSAGMRVSLPPRRTCATGALSFCSDSSAFSARLSCTVPMIALSTTMLRIMIGSRKSPFFSKNEVASDTPAAASKMSTIKSLNCIKNRCSSVSRRAARRRLGPSRRRRCAASVSDSPFSAETPSFLSVSGTVYCCHCIALRPPFLFVVAGDTLICIRGCPAVCSERRANQCSSGTVTQASVWPVESCRNQSAARSP